MAPKTRDQGDDVRGFLESIGADTSALDRTPPTVDQLAMTDDRPFDWVGPTVDKLGTHGVFARAVDDKQVLRFTEMGYTVVEGAQMRGVKGGTAMWCPNSLAAPRRRNRKRRSDARRFGELSDSRGNLAEDANTGGQGSAEVWARSKAERVRGG
jgi:hypothetical protein